MKVGLDGKPNLDWSELTDAQKAAIVEVSVKELGKGDAEGNLPPVLRTKFKLADKRAALMAPAKLCGLIKDDGDKGSNVVQIAKKLCGFIRDSDGKDDNNVQIAKIERVIVHHEPRREYMDDGAWA